MRLSADPTSLPLDPAEVISVSDLNRFARLLLERSFPLLRIAGEISNLTRAASGHLYFTLKDDQAQVRCTMWRNKAQLLGFRPENGMRVEARALVTLYEARGDFQLGIEQLRQAGAGNLFEAFVRLKERLAAEGLFDTAAKRAIPRFPRRIGVVTSANAAALQDIVAAIRRRAPNIPIVLYPAPVQGEGAAALLAEAVRTASRRAASDQLDVLLVARGGGSIEDLWAFNDEALARSIRACPVPVISGVGHETDVTIADFVADLRAATPTGAAELASGGYFDAAIRLRNLARELGGAMRTRLNTASQRLDQSALRLRHPRERLQRSSESVTELARRLRAAQSRRSEQSRSRIAFLGVRLRATRPDLTRQRTQCEQLSARLAKLGRALVERRREQLDALETHLAHLAPTAVLSRGYSITRDARGEILRSTATLNIGDNISVELAEGAFAATVSDT